MIAVFPLLTDLNLQFLIAVGIGYIISGDILNIFGLILDLDSFLCICSLLVYTDSDILEPLTTPYDVDGLENCTDSIVSVIYR